MIDIDKLVVSLLDNPDIAKREKNLLHHALQEQGLRIKDGEIIGIEEKPEPVHGLTDFEKKIEVIALDYAESEDCSVAFAKKKIGEIIDIVRNEVLAKEMEQAYKTADEVQYRKGYEAAVEKACNYIGRQKYLILKYDCNAEGGFTFNLDKTLEEFKKHMELYGKNN